MQNGAPAHYGLKVCHWLDWLFQDTELAWRAREIDLWLCNLGVHQFLGLRKASGLQLEKSTVWFICRTKLMKSANPSIHVCQEECRGSCCFICIHDWGMWWINCKIL
jgi:hypothetical protein